jgi:hypothetical protein
MESNTPASTGNLFCNLYGVNVNPFVEKKGQFSYLSWPFAVAQLRIADPTATWEVIRFNGQPYLATEAGVFVEVAVTAGGITLSQIHPVLDSRNNPIPCPTAFEINSSIQRCLVKAIALHGLGLYVYAGEDLPAGATPKVKEEPKAKAASTQPTPIRPGVATINAEQQAQIQALLTETGSEMDRLLTYFKVERLDQIKATEFNRVIRSLEHRRAA